uniref:Polyubiquitin n=1 Tax=Triatoma infestans TaxID=30076 RepID=A0A161M4X7_TRIIF
MIIALTFLGILTVAFAESPPREVCLNNLEGKQNFEPQKYFKGNWYLTNIHHASTPSVVCRASKLELLEDGSVQKKSYSYTEVGGVTEFVQVNCTGTLNTEKAKVSFQCQHLENSEVKHFSMEGTVLETDYDNFSVYYVCPKEIKFAENYLVASRQKDVEPTDPRIAETLKKLGYSLDTFVARKNVVCKDHPDFN